MQEEPINEVRIINSSDGEMWAGLYFWVWNKKPQELSRGQKYVHFNPQSEMVVKAADLYSVGIWTKKIIPISEVFSHVDVTTLGIELDEVNLGQITIRNVGGTSDTYIIKSVDGNLDINAQASSKK